MIAQCKWSPTPARRIQRSYVNHDPKQSTTAAAIAIKGALQREYVSSQPGYSHDLNDSVKPFLRAPEPQAPQIAQLLHACFERMPALSALRPPPCVQRSTFTTASIHRIGEPISHHGANHQDDCRCRDT